MDPILERRSARFVAALISGGLLFFTVSLQPCWLAAWFAPVPLLLAAFHASARETRLLCATAALIGLTSIIGYYRIVTVGIGSALLIVLLEMGAWMLVVGYTRAIVRRSNHWSTVFAYPLIWAALDTLISAFSPHGTFGSLAYTQMDLLPVVQFASLTGTPGIVFVISLFASMLALALYRTRPRTRPMLAYGLPALILAAVVIFGATRLTNRPEAVETMPIGLVAIDDFIGPKIPRARAEAVWKEYDAGIAQLAHEGGKIIVLPEKIDVKEAAGDERRKALADMARRNGVYLVVGIGLPTESGWKNRAWLFGPSGQLLAEYDKQHLVPGLEAEMTAGRRDVVQEIDGHRFGIAICKDMHFASLGRSYGKRRVAVMLEPAWDFDRDAWMSARLAAMRGIENGYAVVHSARDGLLSASDRYGHFMVEKPSRALPGAAVIARVPVGPAAETPYARYGDWFGWMCVILVVLVRFSPVVRQEV